MRRLKKSIFKGGAAGLVLLLAIIRCTCPGVEHDVEEQMVLATADGQVISVDTILDGVSAHTEQDDATHAGADEPLSVESIAQDVCSEPLSSSCMARGSAPLAPLGEAPSFVDAEGNRVKHRIYSVSSFQRCFPDLQDVQIQSATYWGVRPVRSREQAEQRMNELVYVGSNPYYVMDARMYSSIPYLVPRAADLLQTIGRNFLDSLAIKRIPAHKIVVSSVLRTEEDVSKLRRVNVNASEQSCHRFGTTFDISYRNYSTVMPPGETRRLVRDDTLKYVLSEVLNDVRKAGRCYVKYEVKQACYHITVR